MVSITLEGGLCNQMFQSAFIYAFSKKHNLEYVIPKNVVNPHVPEKKTAYVFPGIKYCEQELDLPVYNESHFHYEEIPKMDNIKFLGYFQSAKYFDEYKDEVIDAFGLEVKKIFQKVCAIHIRRTDYLKFPEHHPAVKMIDLFSAIGVMHYRTGIRNFLVCSDDLEWAKETLGMLPRFEFEFSEGKSEIEDLKLLASCSHIIGANSSYSLWAYYLNPNPNKIGIFPYKWFGPALNHNTKDLYPKNCIII